MTWNNTPPATKALPGVTFANDAPAEKALASVTFDNQAPAEKALASVTFDNQAPAEKALAAASFANGAPAEKAMPGVTFDNGAPTQKSVGAAEFTLLVDATEFATNGLLDAVLEERDAVTGVLVSTKDVETNTAIDPDRELDLQVTDLWASVPAALADRVYLLTTAAGHRYRLVATALPTLNGDTLSVRVESHIPGDQALAAASFSNGSPANKTLAAATFDNDAPAEKAVPAASFDNGAPGEKALAGTTFDNDPPADIGASDPGASWSNDAPAVIVLPGVAPVESVVAPSSPIEVTYSATLKNNQNYRVLVGTRSAPVTITLPDPGGTRQWIEIVDDGQLAETYPITVDPGTKQIEGIATPYVIDVPGAVLEIYYTGTYWKIL